MHQKKWSTAGAFFKSFKVQFEIQSKEQRRKKMRFVFSLILLCAFVINIVKWSRFKEAKKMGIKQVYGFDIRQGFGQSFSGNFIETEF